jgi:hypothetical protein
MSGPAQWLRAGTVGRPHGLDGSFHVVDPNPELLTLGAVLTVGERELSVTRRAGTDRRVILRVEGHDDRAAAQALRGSELKAPRAQAPQLPPDEWWAEDLQGCAVHMEEQVVVIYAGVNGYLDPIPVDRVRAFEHGLLGVVRTQHPEILGAIRDSRDLDDTTSAKLKTAVEAYATSFA